MLNFKTITRENNPQFGKIHNGYWNIPGNDRYYLMKRQMVLDDNGSESILDLKMRQPVAVDLNYKLTIFTTQYHLVNDFNTLITKAFSSRQCYIKPNEHFMPMTLESVSDESNYSIDDRQFYGQTFNIKVMAYIITEDDYRVEQIPYKRGVTVPTMTVKKNMPEAYIEECEDDSGTVTLTVLYPKKCARTVASFTVDTDVTINNITVQNLFNNYEIFVNGEICDKTQDFPIFDGDNVVIKASKQLKTDEASMILNGKINIFSNNT